MNSCQKRSSIGVAFVLSNCFLIAQQKNADYPIQPVAFTQVHVHDHFWAPKMELNANVTIPYVLQKCRETGRVDNFLKAAGKMPVGKITEYPFDDTDIYKVIEGASYALQVKKNPELEKSLDTLIAIIADAQEPDGYLYTFRTMKPEKLHPWISPKRWEKDPDLSHELYNVGHLYEAAVAHYLATGKKSFLNIAIKNADLLVKDFGPGKAEYFPGHQVVEMGLAKMYRITGKKEYLDLAKFFLDIRGSGKIRGSQYSQSHKPVTDQHEAVGHAVRAAYMYTGMADVAALTGDQKYLRAIDDIWNDVVQTKLYLTGGIGATGAGEAFGEPYQLPNMSAYAETCASIASVYWNNRMFLMHGDSKYIDVMERVLYNGLLSGISQDGKRFFYPNPLASMGQHQRSAWFGCACCISNVTRFMPSVPGYVYAQNKNDLYVNLFMSNKADIKLPAGSVSIEQSTDYPWNGKVNIAVSPQKSSAFALHIRIPGWARQEAVPGDLYRFADNASKPISISLNGKKLDYKTEKGYAVINRTWSKGDKVEIDFPMEVEKVLANEKVEDDKGRFALQRGPIVYCIEGPDNVDKTVQNIMVNDKTPVRETFNKDLLNGVLVLTAQGNATKRQLNSDVLLKSEQQVNAIPYYAWNNRGSGEMEVWIPYTEAAARPKPAPTIATKSKISSSLNNQRMQNALNDQYDPKNSNDHSAIYLHWWPKKNTLEWIQYDFDQEYTVSESSVYWFDDGPFGGCRIPASWKVLYKDGDKWVPVKNLTPYEISKDKYNGIRFEPVKTKALRMEVQLPEDFATGVHEWNVK
ncbi:MAG: glycoside hydrolase family 127 protein [Flavisolibacter sp.]|nr:glycoside hydrolase family 127 protein [Flavisolibacter sp.]